MTKQAREKKIIGSWWKTRPIDDAGIDSWLVLTTNDSVVFHDAISEVLARHIVVSHNETLIK